MSLIRLVNVFAINKPQFRSIIVIPSAKYSDGKKDAGSSSSSGSDDSTSSSSDDERKSPNINVRPDKPSAKNRLDALIKSMKSPPAPAAIKIEPLKNVEPPKPIGYKKIQQKQEKQIDVKQSQNAEAVKPKNLEQATKEVAADIGGDPLKNETELVTKLLSYSKTNSPKQSLLELVASMKAEQEPKFERSERERTHSQSKGQYAKYQAGKSRSDAPHFKRKSDKHVPVNLFGDTPLYIFEAEKLTNVPEPNPIWAKLEQQSIVLRRPPENYFEKMAVWTEEGKVWKFPIDNEQGRDEEAKMSFTEHVFLDEHLDAWCPSKGPVRNFMDLVCVGLSKNPYLTVQQKQEHIEWYKHYFEEKKDILQRSLVEKKTSNPELTN